jgi:hypothetical protein
VIDESMMGVVHRAGPLTAADYDEAIADLLAAKAALERGESGGCDVCGSDEHWPSECPHNPLRLARQASAAQSIYRCWHCGYEARNDAEALEHFGRTEFEEPACRRPYRTMDASGSPEAAGSVGWEWINGVAERARADDPNDLELMTPELGADGSAMTLYRGTKLIAAAFVYRDQMNFAVLIRWLPAVEGGA